MLVILQLGILYLLIQEFLADSNLSLATYPSSGYVVMIRFLVCWFLRLKSDPEISQGMKFMKYTSNHEENFYFAFTGFFAGWLQCTVSMVIELFNLCYILDKHTIFAAFKGYLSVFLLTTFDDMIYASLKDEPLKMLIEKEPYNRLLI